MHTCAYPPLSPIYPKSESSAIFVPGTFWVNLRHIPVAYHENLYIMPSGCILHIKKQVEIYRIVTKNSQKSIILSAKKIKYDTFWDQIQTGLSFKKAKNLLFIIVAFWLKNQLYQM